jgi:hypothetical protein
LPRERTAFLINRFIGKGAFLSAKLVRQYLEIPDTISHPLQSAKDIPHQAIWRHVTNVTLDSGDNRYGV